jgi:putative chitinase
MQTAFAADLASATSPAPLPRQAAELWMPPVDAGLLWAVAPRFRGQKGERQRAIIDAVGPVLAPVLASYRIRSTLRIAHFTAQTCHESAGFRTTEEFASGAAYEGREDLGNTHPGDGRRYKGRGLIQLTGRANYGRLGTLLGVDLVAEPEAAAEPVLSLRIACTYWEERGINRPADDDDLIAVTRLVNGGTNGLADRRACLRRAKDALARLAAGEVAPAPGGRPVLHRRASGEAVVELQAALRDNGFALAVDGAFGPATELAVRLWQRSRGLVPDGIVGPRTWKSLGL